MLLPTIMHSRRGPGRNEMDEVCRVLQCIVTDIEYGSQLLTS